MKTIGFIDYELDNWHANNYPEMIREASEGKWKVAYAWGYQDCEGGLSSREWADKFGVELCATEDEVIEKSDCLIVLSPNNPEMHERLCQKALSSGKPTYVDKTFAPDAETARRIFEVAEKSGTPCFSTSALRYSTELEGIDRAQIERIYSEGPGPLEIYSIHQIEPIVCLMQTEVKRIMALDTEAHPSFVIEFEDGRKVQMVQRDDPSWSFRLQLINHKNEANVVQIESDYFGNFIQAMIRFFDTKEVPVPHAETVRVMAIRETAIQAAKTPFEWLQVK